MSTTLSLFSQVCAATRTKVLNSYSKLFGILGSLLVSTVEMRVIGMPGETWSQVSF